MNVQKKLSIIFLRNYLKLLYLLNNRKAGALLFKLFCTPLPTPPVQPGDAFSNQEKLSFTLNNKKVYGYRCNAGGSRKALLLHGFSSSIHKFGVYVKPLTQLGYEVLAFDAPAHGLSEGKTINAIEYKEMVEHIFKNYGDIDAVVSHSFGGLALSLAMENSPAHPPVKMVLIAPATETTTAIRQALKMLGLSKHQGLAQALENKIVDYSGKPSSWFSIRRAIRQISHPVLWVQDETDRITPMEDVQKVQQDAPPNVRFFITKGLGHRRIYTAPNVIQEIMNFLK